MKKRIYGLLVLIGIIALLQGCSAVEDRVSDETPIDHKSEEISVQKQVSELMLAADFGDLEYEEKQERVDSLLDSLYENDLILQPAEYDDEQQLYTFTFADNILGGISLKESDERLNSAPDEPAQVFADPFNSAPAASVLIMNGFEDTPFRRDYYENLGNQWNAMGYHTVLDTDITVADMTQISVAEVIVFAMHGSTYQNTPVLCLNEQVTDETDAQYAEHLSKDQTVAKVFCNDDTFHYWVFPSFFEHNYAENDLDGRVVFSESCNFYGSDNTLIGLNTSFSDVFLSKSAEAVLGYYNSVGAEYSRNVMKCTIDSMFGAYTADAALSEAIVRYGADDQFEDVSRGKYKAYPVLQGDKNAKLAVKIDSVHAIPSSMMQNPWSGSESMEYCPGITFYENMQCELKMNIDYTIRKVTGTYTVTMCQDDRRLIRCDYTGAAWGDGVVRENEYFYLVEETEDVWTYYGENIGLTFCTDTFAGDGSKTLLQSVNTNVPILTPMEGIYCENAELLNVLTVSEVYDNNRFRFTADWYRWTGLTETEAAVYGNIAVFSGQQEPTGQATKGVIESSDGALTIHLFETPLMENGAHFTYPIRMSFEEAEQASYNRMAKILLENDDQRGWVLSHSDEQPEYTTAAGGYLRFYENGIVDYWTAEENGEELVYSCSQKNYYVDKDTLYIDGNAYNYFAEMTGNVYLQLNALAPYAEDLSGYYWCEGNRVYTLFYYDFQ